jgi:hypothetical protein
MESVGCRFGGAAFRLWIVGLSHLRHQCLNGRYGAWIKYSSLVQARQVMMVRMRVA